MALWRLLRAFDTAAMRALGLAVVLSGISAAATNAILAWAAVHQRSDGAGAMPLLVFLAVLVAEKLGMFSALMRMCVHVTRANALLQLDVVRRIAASDLLVVERIGISEISATFSRCTATLATGVSPLSRLVYPASGLVGTSVILVLTSGETVGLFLAGLGATVLVWIVCQRVLSRRFAQAMVEERDLSTALGELVRGFTEIKFNPAKGVALEQERIAFVVKATAAARSATGTLMALCHVMANAVNLLLAAAVGVVLPAMVPELADAGAIAATVIIMLPTGSLEYATDVARWGAATGEMAALKQALPAEAGAELRRALTPVPGKAPFAELAFRGVTFAYEAGVGGDGFRVGPLSFTLRRGEITFIVGGNGSGKSTLTRLLTGLIRRERGEILFDGVAQDMLAARDNFGAIFGDFHQFDRLYGYRDAEPRQVQALLRRFGLEGITRYENGRFSTLALSTGQRKRLAMVVCLIEDKPVFVLDEWAADQDPGFREMYYRELLPELRRRGKTVIAVTHDDRYFDVADQVIKLERGVIVS